MFYVLMCSLGANEENRLCGDSHHVRYSSCECFIMCVRVKRITIIRQNEDYTTGMAHNGRIHVRNIQSMVSLELTVSRVSLAKPLQSHGPNSELLVDSTATLA